MCDVVDLNCCSEWAENESYFSIFEKTLEIGEMTVHYFLGYMLCVGTFINIVTRGAFYFIDLKNRLHLPS